MNKNKNNITRSVHSKHLWIFLWEAIKPYAWWFLLIFQAPVLTAFYMFSNHYSFKLIVDAFSSEETLSYTNLLLPIFLFVMAQMVLDLLWRLSEFATMKVDPFVKRAILTSSFNTVLHHPYPYFQNTPTGTTVSQLKGLMDGYEALFENLRGGIGKHFCVVLFSIGVLYPINSLVFGFMIAWSLLFLGVMLPFAKQLHHLAGEMAESKHNIIGALSDNLTNIFSLFYFSRRHYEHNRLKDFITQDYLPKQVHLFRYDFKFQMMGALFYWIMLIGIFLFMISLRLKHLVSTGNFLFVTMTTVTISFELWALMHSICSFFKEIAALKSSYEVLTYPNTFHEPIQAKAIPINQGKIEFKQLSFAYDHTKPLFNNFNLTIEPGQKIGIVGHSGAGKSTLISLLLKNFQPSQGLIEVDGTPIDSISADSLRAQIAYIPQDIILFHRSIAENIGYGKIDASFEDIKQAAQHAHLHNFIESLPQQYETMVGERGLKLSGGQRQRIAIARAFLKKAPIVIFDEATSNLDSITEQDIQSSIHQMCHQKKMTMIAIAHRLSTLRHMDRIVVIEGGRIIEDGSFELLLNQPKGYFKTMWVRQMNDAFV